MAEGEPEADRDRALAIGHQLARGVVDSGDVISVERMAHTKRVCRDAEADSEDTSRSEAVVPRRNNARQKEPADDVQGSHEARHPGDGCQLPAAQRTAKPSDPGGRIT